MQESRAQVYLDISMPSGGGGTKPDGTPTKYVDLAYVLEQVTKNSVGLVLDPKWVGQDRWHIQCALRDAFGWDGKKDPEPHQLDRLRKIAAEMDFLPSIRVRRVVVLDKHDDCHMPHPGDD